MPASSRPIPTRFARQLPSSGRRGLEDDAAVGERLATLGMEILGEQRLDDGGCSTSSSASSADRSPLHPDSPLRIEISGLRDIGRSTKYKQGALTRR